MIHLNNITRKFNTGSVETTALNSINLKVERGEFAVIAGYSGSGKSTLLQILGILDFPNNGKYILNGIDIYSLHKKQLAQIRNKYIGFIFQAYNLIPQLTVYENVELPLIYRGDTKNERKRKVRLFLDRVGLSNRMGHYPGQLSGGQQQRVAIARSLVGEPKLLLGDEPTGNLDTHIGAEIIKLLQEINCDLKTTIMMVTHNKENFSAGNKFYQMIDGRVNAKN